jgi:hypothetical protein
MISTTMHITYICLEDAKLKGYKYSHVFKIIIKYTKYFSFCVLLGVF